MNRRKFAQIAAGSAFAFPALLKGVSDALEAPPSETSSSLPAPAQSQPGDSAVAVVKEPYEYSRGVIEQMLEKLFGERRDKPTPLPTIKHLDSADLTFVAFTDAHMCPVGVKTHMGYLTVYNSWVEEVIRQSNAVHPEFALDLGDSIWATPSDPNDAWYEPAARHALEVFSRLNCPLHKVAGTHDFGNHSDPYDSPQLLKNLEIGRNWYHRFFGKDYYSFDVKGCHFIAFNNALANVDSPEAHEQMQWLKEDLKGAENARLCFFLSHEPFFWGSPDEGVAGRWNVDIYFEPARAELLQLLSAHGVDCVYSGHVHFDFGNQYKGMYLHTLNSCSNNREHLAATGTPRPFPTAAEGFDPYKFGYLVVRIRGQEIHESWVSTCWRVNDPPPELARLKAGRIVARPAHEVEDSVLGLVVPPPPRVDRLFPPNFQGFPFIKGKGPGYEESIINDHWWRLGENIGSKWLQARSVPSDEQEWSNLSRGLTLGRPRGVKIAVPLPADPIAMGLTWSKIDAISDEIAAAVVLNGGPTFWFYAENPHLVTWRPEGTVDSWAKACVQARELVPPSTKVVLARFALRELYVREELPEANLGSGVQDDLASDGAPGSGLAYFEEVASAISGKADVISVWARIHGAPEEYSKEIATIAEVGRSHGLEVWLDAIGWEYIDSELQSVYLLRLMALCQSNGVRLFWWNGPPDEAGLLDGFYDPTPMYYAAQAWQTFIDGPTKPVKSEEIAGVITIRWKDRRGRDYLVWWNPSKTTEVEITARDLDLPKSALIADPLHGQLLELETNRIPVCGWPLIARG